MGKKDASDAAENIKVIVRCRPLNSKEKDNGYKSCISMDLAEGTVQVNHVMGEPDRWTFDGVVNNTLSQNDIFVQYITPMIDSVLNGFNSTIFAYGQSGSGKSYTMTGVYQSEELKGITPRSFRYVFDTCRREQETHPGRKYTMSCSYVELYNNKVRDLLATKQEPLDVKEAKDKSFFVKGAIIDPCRTVDDLINKIEEGNTRRQVAATELNADSSRSHSIFTLFLEMVETTEDNDVRSVTSKLNLVDLAGSERQSKTGATGDTLKEGCNINLSLSTLGTVIDALVKGKPHIPYRGNPLTALLKDSLGGNSKTCMFANINPSEHNISETISTLRFADRAKQIKNKPIIMLDAKDQKIKELTEQVQTLKDKLKQFEGAGVKGLEDELEATKEKLDETNTALENAEKSREDDRNEFVERLEAASKEKEELEKAAKEIQLSLDAIKGEKELLEQRLANESKRRIDWKKMLKLELGSGDQEGEEENAASDDNIASEEDKNNSNSIEAILEQIRTMRNSFIDPQVHETKLGEAETRRKNAENEVSELNGSLDKLKKELSEMTFNFEQATKKTGRLQEKLDREKESRKTIAETEGGNSVSPSPAGRARSFRRHSSAGNVLAGGDVSFSGVSPARDHSLNLENEKLKSDLEAKDNIIKNLEEQLSSGKELSTLQEELDRVKQSGEEMQKKMAEQISALTASISEPSNNDSEREKIIKKALLAKDAALTAALSQTKQLEDRLASLIDLRKNVAVGDIRNIEGDVIRHQGEIRSSILEDLSAVSSQRNKLLNLFSGDEESSSSATATSEEIKNQIQSLIEENEQLRSKSKTSSDSAGLKAEADALRAALVDQKRAGEEAVKMVEKQKEELHKKIESLEEQIEKAEDQALEKFLSSHKKKQNKDEGEDEEEEDPLRTALNVLQREKNAINAELTSISRELQHVKVELALKSSSSASGGAGGGPVLSSSVNNPLNQFGSSNDAMEQSVLSISQLDEGSFEALKNECLRLRALLYRAGISPRRKQSMTSPSSVARKKTVKASPSFSGTTPTNSPTKKITDADEDADELQSSFLEIEQSMANEVSAANFQASELRDELETAKADVEEANDRRDAAIKERDTAQQETSDLKQQLRSLQQTLDDTKSRVTDLETESEKQKKNLEAQFSQNILSLESRLREKGDLLAEQQKLVEGQTAVANSLRERTEMLQAELEKQQAEAKKREERLNDQLEQQETSFQKLLTRRLEEQKEQHQKALIRKDDDMHDLRKKMKKLEDKMDKLRQQFDEKVCEYEELAQAMEEQKMTQLQQLRGGGGSNGGGTSQAARELRQADQSRRGVDDAIRTAREERARRNDVFSGSIVGGNNTNNNNNNTSHAAGSASVVARARREIGGTYTPPTDEVRSGYTTGASSTARASGGGSSATANSRVMVNNDTYRGGGSGYTGYSGIGSSSGVTPTTSLQPMPSSLAPLPLAPMPPSGTGTRPNNAAPVRGFPGIGNTNAAPSPEKNTEDDMYYF